MYKFSFLLCSLDHKIFRSHKFSITNLLSRIFILVNSQIFEKVRTNLQEFVLVCFGEISIRVFPGRLTRGIFNKRLLFSLLFSGNFCGFNGGGQSVIRGIPH